jgi:hypothetical protein
MPPELFDSCFLPLSEVRSFALLAKQTQGGNLQKEQVFDESRTYPIYHT